MLLSLSFFILNFTRDADKVKFLGFAGPERGLEMGGGDLDTTAPFD